MGVVYLAEDLRLRRRVALKLLAASLAADERFRERFLAESRLAASLDHPCVVPIYEAGEGDGLLFIAMRYVEGSDLKALLRGGPLTAGRTVGVCAQVADALDVAHGRGLVHRDVKPSNVLLDDRDHAYLADFGLTKRQGEPQGAEPGLLGTIDYVAPEQIRGEQVDGRADQYALGCLLYECLVGEPPFARSTDAAILFAHLEERPPAPPGLELVMQTGLAKEPEQRYATCGELVLAAGEALGIGARSRGLAFLLGGVVCPFKGLACFDRSDAEYFCGRERLVSEVVARLAASTLVAILGPSGIGKSSLLRAGVLPALSAGLLPGSAGWRQILLRPGEHPCAQLTRAIGGERLDAAVARLAGDERIVVAIDQLEELFTACEQEPERAAFLEQLVTAAHHQDQRALVLCSLRADFYGRLVAYPEFAQVLSASHVLVGPMDHDELARAIEQPATRAGLELEQPLVDALVSDVAGEPGGLPLLSTMLLELWQARDGRTLRFEHYRTSGGVRGAVARLAERAFIQLGESEQAVARNIMLRLVGGEDAALVRRRIPLADLHQIDGADRVLAALTDARLVTVTDDEAELAHEALLHEWPRYGAWLQEDQAGRHVHAHLTTSAREWDAGGRDPGELYRGARLAGALDWAAQHDDQMNALERDYLHVSRRQARREVRRLRGLLTGVGALLVIAVLAGTVSLIQRATAIDETRVAQSQLIASQAIRETDPELASLLAVGAYTLSPTIDARSAILTAVNTNELGAPLTGHTGPVFSMAFSPDGRLLVSAGADGTVWLWDVVTHRQLGTLTGQTGHTGRVYSVAFSPDSRTLASGGADGTVRLWDVATHRQLGPPLTGQRRPPRSRPPRVPDEVRRVAFSPNGRTLASAGDDGTIRLWNVATHRQLGPPLTGHFGPVESVAFSPDGRTLVSGSDDGKVRLWDVRTHKQLCAPLTGHTDVVESVAFSPDGRTLASAGNDGTVRLWDVATHHQLGTPLSGRTAIIARIIMAVAFSPDGRTLASAGFDATVRLWNVVTHRQLRSPLIGHTGTIWSVAFSPDGRTLASASDDATVRLWNIATTNRRQLDEPFHTGAVGTVAFSPDGRTLASASADRTVRLWDVATHRQLGSPLGPVNTGSAFFTEHLTVAFSPDGRTLAASTGEDDTVRLWDVITHRQLGSPLGPVSTRSHRGRPLTGAVDGVAFGPTGGMLASADGHSIRLWDVATHRQLGSPLTANTLGANMSVAFSPDGRTLASGGADGTVRLWDVATHRQLGSPLTADTYMVDSVAFSPDARTIASAGSDTTVRLWDVATHRQLGPPLTGHTDVVESVAFSPDGRTLASASDDATVRLWDVATHRQLGPPLTGHTDTVQTVAFSPDGRTLASGGLDGTIRLWTSYPIKSYIQQACRLINAQQARQLWNQAVSSIAFPTTVLTDCSNNRR